MDRPVIARTRTVDIDGERRSIPIRVSA